MYTESTERFIEDQAFLWSYDSAPRPPLPPSVPSLSESSCVSPGELADGRCVGGGVGGGASYSTARKPGPL